MMKNHHNLINKLNITEHPKIIFKCNPFQTKIYFSEMNSIKYNIFKKSNHLGKSCFKP